MAAIARRAHAVRDDALVIAESGLNDPRVMRTRELGGHGCDAAWADDFHHSLRTLLTDDREGYYAEFGRVAQLAKAFHRPHVHDGNYSEFRRRRFGAPADDVPPRRFVVFSQDHDQVGNRAFGDRMPESARPLAAFCVAALAVRAAAVHGRGVRRDRRHFSSSPTTSTSGSPTPPARAAGASSPRSQSSARRFPTRRIVATFERSKLTRRRDPALAGLYAELLAARRRLPPGDADEIEFDEAARWLRVRRGAFELLCNFAARAQGVPCVGTSAELFTHDPPRIADGRAQLALDVGGADRMRESWPGRPFPLGATWDGGGTNFSLFSEHAEWIELCLFDDDGEESRVEMTQRQAQNWHCYVPGVSPGQRYGFRVHGPYAPLEGHRFNASKLLIDPYAKAIEGVVDWSDSERLLPYIVDGTEDADLEPHHQDDAAAIPKSIVIDDAFIWEGDRPPRVPFSNTVIYETHVKGFTMKHPGVREDLRGTYAGLASDEAIAYLLDLGVTAVELLPVHHIADESFLTAARPAQLLGLQHDRLPGSALRVRRHRPPRRAGARVQGDGQGVCTAPASR